VNRILVVDKHRDGAIRLLYVDGLSEEGYDVRAVQNGPGLQKVIDATKPDVVLLDVTGEEGAADEILKIFRRIRRRHKDLPVVASSIYATPNCRKVRLNKLLHPS